MSGLNKYSIFRYYFWKRVNENLSYHFTAIISNSLTWQNKKSVALQKIHRKISKSSENFQGPSISDYSECGPPRKCDCQQINDTI